MEKESKVYFSLGSNLGDKEGNIHEAIRRMAELVGTVERQSMCSISRLR